MPRPYRTSWIWRRACERSRRSPDADRFRRRDESCGSANPVYLLPEVVVAFQPARPGAVVRIVSGNWSRTIDALRRSHRAEVGVVGGFAAAPEIDSEREESIIVVGAPALGGRSMSRRGAEAVTWVSPYEGSATRAAVEAAWADMGITPFHRLEFPTGRR